MDNVLATYKQLEQALRYLGVIAEQTSEGVAVLDEAGIVQFVNPAWVIMHGHQSASDFIGRPISAFLAGQQQKADGMAFIEQAAQRGCKLGLCEHLRGDGTSFLAQMRATVVKDEAGRATGFVVFAADITQRRRLEERLRNNTRRVVQFAERITWLGKLLAEARDLEESLTREAGELDADGQELRERIAQWAQSQEMPAHAAKNSHDGELPLPEPSTYLIRSGRASASSDGRDLSHRAVAGQSEQISAGPKAAPEPPQSSRSGNSASVRQFRTGLEGPDGQPSSGPTKKAERIRAGELLETDSQGLAGTVRQFVHKRRNGPEAHGCPLNAEELRKVAELGRRLAGLTR